MFQNFPYTDMHQLNLDWVIKIAKDFLDQYTHIEEVISNGETSLEQLTENGTQQLINKASELETALNAWYTEHSSDISDQLADALLSLTQNLNTAINSFNAAAEAKAADTIATIPADYTALANTVAELAKIVYSASIAYQYLNTSNIITGKYCRIQDGRETTSENWKCSDYIDIEGLNIAVLVDCWGCFYDSTKTFISSSEAPQSYPNTFRCVIPANTKYVRISCPLANSPELYTEDLNSVTTLFDFHNAIIPDSVIPLSAIKDAGNLEILTQIITLHNIINDYVPSVGYFLRPQDGAIRSGYASFKAYQDYIDITDTIAIKIKNAYMAYYASDKAFISTVNNDEGYPENIYTPPVNAKYIRIGTSVNYSPEIYLQKFDNIIKDGTMIDGLFLRPQDGGIRENPDFMASDFIDVSKIKQITFKTCYAVSYDAEYVFIESFGPTDNSIETVDLPAGSYYIRIGHSKSLGNDFYAYDTNSKQWSTKFNPVNMEFEDDSIPKSAVQGLEHQNIPTNITTFGVNNGSDYDDIQEAVARSDGSDTILVTRGTYEQYFQIANDSYGNKRTAKNIVGLDKFTCVFTRHGSAYADDVMHTGKESYIKGVTLKAMLNDGATTCGYAVHADNNWLEQGSPVIFEDCVFISEGRASVGIGTRHNSNLIFRNCIFITESEQNNGAVFFHNSPSNDGDNQRLTFINCEFYSNVGSAVYIQMVGNDENIMELTMVNCLLHSKSLGVYDIITVDKSLYTGSGSNIHITNKTYGNNVNISDYIH